MMSQEYVMCTTLTSNNIWSVAVTHLQHLYHILGVVTHDMMMMMQGLYVGGPSCMEDHALPTQPYNPPP